MFHEGRLQDATQSLDKRFMSECQVGFLFWVWAKRATQLKSFLVDGVAGWTLKPLCMFLIVGPQVEIWFEYLMQE